MDLDYRTRSEAMKHTRAVATTLGKRCSGALIEWPVAIVDKRSRWRGGFETALKQMLKDSSVAVKFWLGLCIGVAGVPERSRRWSRKVCALMPACRKSSAATA